MRILLIGGNGFIGSPLASELRDCGHSVAIFHRSADKSLDKNVVRIQGDRNRLFDHLEQIQRFSPEVIVDLILSSGEQARQLISTSRKVARRVIAISSMDVYRAWGVVHQSEPGPLEALPLTEDSPPRTNRQLYPPETVKMMQSIFRWVDEHYDKIPVEEAIMNSTEISGTVLRLPMVYGPGDPLHRVFPLLKRMMDRRTRILLFDEMAAWRSPRGYVENVAAAIALAACSDRAVGEIYNVAEEPAFSELEWARQIAAQARWDGEFTVLPRERTPKHLLVPGNFRQQGIASSNKIRQELGFQEPVSIADAIRRTIAWEKENPPAEVSQEQFDYPAEDRAVAA